MRRWPLRPAGPGRRPQAPGRGRRAAREAAPPARAAPHVRDRAAARRRDDRRRARLPRPRVGHDNVDLPGLRRRAPGGDRSTTPGASAGQDVRAQLQARPRLWADRDIRALHDLRAARGLGGRLLPRPPRPFQALRSFEWADLRRQAQNTPANELVQSPRWPRRKLCRRWAALSDLGQATSEGPTNGTEGERACNWAAGNVSPIAAAPHRTSRDPSYEIHSNARRPPFQGARRSRVRRAAENLHRQGPEIPAARTRVGRTHHARQLTPERGSRPLL